MIFGQYDKIGFQTYKQGHLPWKCSLQKEVRVWNIKHDKTDH